MIGPSKVSSSAALAIVALATIATLAGCTAANTGSARPPKPTQSTAPVGPPHPVGMLTSCPAKQVKPPASAMASARAKLVPIDPDRAIICTYGTFDQHSALLHSRTLASGAVLTRIVTELNEATQPPPTDEFCPADFGAAVDIYLSSDAGQIEVALQPSGCRVATNGTFTTRVDASTLLRGLGVLKGIRA